MRYSAVVLFFVSGLLQAHTACLEGAYTHDFTHAPGAIVWQISGQGEHYQLLRTADRQAVNIHALSKNERAMFWKRMQWLPDSAKGAECAADENLQTVVCELSSQSRKKEPALRNTDYFYYDPSSGVMTISRIDE